jgi:hypothetical protein
VEPIEQTRSQEVADRDSTTLDKQAPDPPSKQHIQDIPGREKTVGGGQVNRIHLLAHALDNGILPHQSKGFSTGPIEYGPIGWNSTRRIQDHSKGWTARTPTQGQLAVILEHRTGPHQNRITESTQTVGVLQILGTRDPMGLAVFSGDIPIHALREMPHDKWTSGWERTEERQEQRGHGLSIRGH